jgi:hypothetical protein
LGIGGFGTFLLLQYNEKTNFHFSNSMKVFFFASIVFFGLSAAFALAHRFCASDSMSYHISYLRKTEDIAKQKEKDGRRKMLKLSGSLLQWNAIFFGLGVVCFAVGVFLILFS